MALDRLGEIPALVPGAVPRRVRSPFKTEGCDDESLSSSTTIIGRGPVKPLMHWYRQKAHDSSSDIEDHSEVDACIEHMACALTPLQLRGGCPLLLLPLGASPVRRFVRLHLDTPDLSSMLTIEEADSRSRSPHPSPDSRSRSPRLSPDSRSGSPRSSPHQTADLHNSTDAHTKAPGLPRSSSLDDLEPVIDRHSADDNTGDSDYDAMESTAFINTSGSSYRDCDSADHAGDERDTTDYADQTVYADSSDDEPQLIQSTPAFIDRRKRHLHEHSPANNSQLYPGQTLHSGNITSPASDTLQYNSNQLLFLLSRYSFSCSDSTPCPSEPNRKKLRSKNMDMTPLNPGRAKHLLDFARSIRAPADPRWKIFSDVSEKSDIGVDDIDCDVPEQGTPISQSTPANSRPSTPPKDPQALGESTHHSGGGSAGGDYRFVASPNSYFTPKTVHPSLNLHRQRTPASVEMRACYARGDYAPQNYQILGEMPVTAAGLMDESLQDVHVGDKRIGDPYAMRPLRAGHAAAGHAPGNAAAGQSLEQAYRDTSAIRLPLPPPFFYTQHNMPASDLLLLVRDPATVGRFYSLILGDQNRVQVIKADRLRWHPDKWEARLRDELLFFDMQIVVALTQLINVLLESTS